MRRTFSLCWLLILTPALASAQTAKIQAEVDKQLAQARAYEEIEILRRLLQRKAFTFLEDCRKCHVASDLAGAPNQLGSGGGGEMGPTFGGGGLGSPRGLFDK